MEALSLITIADQAAPGTQASRLFFESAGSAAAFWQSYRWWIIGLAFLLLIETIIIVGLLRKSAKRRRRERSLQANQERLRRELAGFARMASMRELLSSLAHEVNQPLAAILANAETGQQMSENRDIDPGELNGIFKDIIADDRRVAETIRSLRAKVGFSVAERRAHGFNELVEEVVWILRNDFLVRKITVESDLDSSNPSITGDRLQLQQVVLSLLVNACEAMAEANQPRKLLLRSRASEQEVVMDVVDTGIGIPVEKLDSIFDPFVTIKPERLGMGLFLSRSIVMGHNGRLWAENNAGGGAAFHLALPLEGVLPPTLAVGPGQDFESEVGQPSQGIAVLLADDGELFRKSVSAILKKLPELKLLSEAADGAEAVRKAADMKPDLVLLDLGLPLIHGVEAASKIRMANPNAKILFLSHHDSPDLIGAALRAGAQGYVLKLDVGSELMHAVKAVLRGEQYISSGVRR